MKALASPTSLHRMKGILDVVSSLPRAVPDAAVAVPSAGDSHETLQGFDLGAF